MGIAMAIVLAVVPPGNYGGDPGHTRKINNYHWRSVQTVIEFLISCDAKSHPDEAAKHIQTLDALSNKIFRKSATMREITADFEKDAARLQTLPCFRVDPRLRAELGNISRDIYVASFVPRFAAKIMGSEGRSILLEKGGPVQRRLEEIRDDMAKVGIAAATQTSKENFHLPSSDFPDTREDIDLLLLSIQWLVAEMRGHEEALKTIGRNQCGIYRNFSL